MNYVEIMPSVVIFTLAAGAFWPRASAGLALLYMIGRELYGRGYVAKGPGARMSGNLLSALPLVSLLGMSVYGVISTLLMGEIKMVLKGYGVPV